MSENEQQNNTLDKRTILTKEDVIKNKNEAILKISRYLDDCILNDNKYLKKANLLSYWIKNHIDYLEKEEDFDSSTLKQYSRGDIIKAHLGFNVGNEEGGLHYCIVLDKKNAKSHSTLTIIPLTSQKPGKRINNASVLLGNELYISLDKKNKLLLKTAKEEVVALENQLFEIDKLPETTDEEKIIKEFKVNELSKLISESHVRLDLIEKINNELIQMKYGSIALINQITTISKQRIFNPKRDLDILSGITLSDEKMKLIDKKLKKFYVI